MAKKRGRDKKDKLPVGFAESVESMSDEEIKERIVTIERGVCELKKAMKSDETYQEAKNHCKELKETYSVPIKEHGYQIDYLCELLEQRGK